MSKSTIHLIVDSGPKQGETLDRKPGSLIRIGRVVKGNTLAIKDHSISQKHLTIEFDPQSSRWGLRDLDTSNGTFINGDRVPSSASVLLSDGDAIKIGACTSISVKISVVEENIGGLKRGARGRGRSKKDDGILDSVVEDRAEDLSKDEILGSALGDGIEAKSLGRERRENSARVSTEDNIEVPDSKSDDCDEIKNRNCESIAMKDEILDLAAEDGAKDVRKNLGRGSKRNSTRGSKKKEVLESGLDDSTKVLENSGGEDGRNSSSVSNKDEISEKVVEDRMKALGNLGRGRRAKSAKVSQTDDAPKILRRGRRTNSTQILEKDPSLDSVAEDRNEKPENLGKHRVGNSAGVLMDDEHLYPVVEGFIDMPKNSGRGRRTNLVSASKKDVSLEDNIEMPKTMRVGRRTRSTKAPEKDHILDFVAEDKIQVPKNVGRGRKTSSSRVSAIDETLDPVAEDRTEVRKNLGRGKRRAKSKVSKIDEISDVVVGDAGEVTKNVDRDKPRRAPARKTRASSRVLKDQQLLQPAQLNLKDTVLNPVENLHQSKELTEGSHIRLISFSPADSKDKKCQNTEDKENYVSVKCQKTENETTSMGKSCYKTIPDIERPIPGSVSTQTHEPSHVLAKVWNGNGIPNTTTKYKEDQKVSWHATPFEERVEKALSDDKIFPHRKLTD